MQARACVDWDQQPKTLLLLKRAPTPIGVFWSTDAPKVLALHLWSTTEPLAGCMNKQVLSLQSAWQPFHRSLNFIWILMLALCWLYSAEFSHSHYRLNHHKNFLHYCCSLTYQNPLLQEITWISTQTTSKIWQVNILLQWDLKSGLQMLSSPEDIAS